MPDIKHFEPDVALARVERLFWKRGSATTSIQVIAAETGLNRSSLYATFGGKGPLYLAALRRYVECRVQPVLHGLARDERGIPAIRDFFHGLIEARCSGEYAGWGCMIVNAYSDPERDDPAVRAELDEYHQRLRDAFRDALENARRKGELSPGIAAEAAAEAVVLLAYGVNVRSRAGADADTLHRAVAMTLASLSLEG